MGHPSVNVLNKISTVNENNCHFSTRDVCHFAKQHMLSFDSSDSHSLSIFDIIHVDVWGPYMQVTHNKCYYFIIIVDDYSKVTWVFLFSHKTQVFNLLINFLVYVKNQFHTAVKTLRSNNGT